MNPPETPRLFQSLPAEDQEFLVSRGVERTYEPGEVIFTEGDPGDGLYVVLRGEVEITIRASQDAERLLARIPAGEYFGEMAVIDHDRRSATARSAPKSTLLFLPSEAVLALMDRSPRLAGVFVRVASQRLREFNRRFLQQLVRAERLTLVERLARSIVHDFRNPLNVIGIAADLAAETGAPIETRVASRDRIRKQVDVINSMMQELLEFTRATHSPTVLARVNFADVVNSALVELRQEAHRRAVALEVPVAPPSATVHADTSRLTRVLTNLFQNAFDAVADKPVGRIALRFQLAEDEVTTELEDNGKGIAPQLLTQLFEPFVTHGKAHGTGLGLAICEKIISEHGGRIGARSTPGQGAVFSFTLPVLRPAEFDRPPQPLPALS